MKSHVLAVVAIALGGMLQAQVAREWVISDFYSAEYVLPFELDSYYANCVAIGDLDDDSAVDCWVESEVINPSGVNSTLRYRLFSGPDRPPAFDTEGLDSGFSTTSRSFSMAFLRSPLGLLLATRTDLHPNDLSVWDLGQVSLLALVPPPPPPPSPPPLFFADQCSAGDVNLDGWDDVFFQTVAPSSSIGDDCVLGLLDGATLVPLWQYRHPHFYAINWIRSTSAIPTPDLDSDGVRDFVSDFSLYDPQVGHFESLFTALSGVDGSVIWQVRGPSTFSRSSSLGGDYDADGIVDLFSVADPDILVLSGADGSVIWSGTTQMLGGHVPPGTIYYRMYGDAFPSVADDRTPGAELCIPTGFSLGFGIWQMGITHVDPPTGNLIDLALFPPDLLPWSTDPMSGLVWATMTGDIDRDGLRELAMTVWAPSADNPASAWPDEHLAILSLRTLGVPATVKLGATLPVDLSLPGAAGRRFLLLVSDAFDPRGGVVLNGWRTFLARTPLFAAAFNHPALRGTLSAGGDATLAVPLPGNPALLGRTLYLRAAAEGGPGSIWTLSTLGETEIVP